MVDVYCTMSGSFGAGGDYSEFEVDEEDLHMVVRDVMMCIKADLGMEIAKRPKEDLDFYITVRVVHQK